MEPAPESTVVTVAHHLMASKSTVMTVANYLVTAKTMAETSMAKTSVAHKFASRVCLSLSPLVESRAEPTMVATKTAAESNLLAPEAAVVAVANHSVAAKSMAETSMAETSVAHKFTSGIGFPLAYLMETTAKFAVVPSDKSSMMSSNESTVVSSN